MIWFELVLLWLSAFILGGASVGLWMSCAYDTRRLTPAPIYHESHVTYDGGAVNRSATWCCHAHKAASDLRVSGGV